MHKTKEPVNLRREPEEKVLLVFSESMIPGCSGWIEFFMKDFFTWSVVLLVRLKRLYAWKRDVIMLSIHSMHLFNKGRVNTCTMSL